MSSSSSSSSRRNDAFEYLADGPFCLVAVENGRAVKTNRRFEELVGPHYKFSNYDFFAAASEGKDQSKLKEAMQQAAVSSSPTSSSVRVTNIEMVTLVGEAGLPFRRHFDWTIGRETTGVDDTNGSTTTLLLFGYPCTEDDVEQRSKDQELVDFFQNAPIALHWLSGEGIVLWANQTELDVLGYTAEEYIGQPIMKFCPDEEELVLEIFKQLGSGNSIKDVPVRFRTKDGRIVNLLIDSNVKYDDKTGAFGHTRCFIRDDTGRIVQEAKAKTLLEETKRSLKMLDNFMSRSIHHMRTPMQVMQNTCELVISELERETKTPAIETSIGILKEATANIDLGVALADDIIQLSRLDQGAELEVNNEVVDLVELGKEIYHATSKLISSDKVMLTVELQGGGGPSKIFTDSAILKKILRGLLEQAADVTVEGEVKLQVSYQNKRCTFSVTDSGPGYDNVSDTASGVLPPIFQLYQQQVIPEDIVSFSEVADLRSNIEKGVNSTKNNSIGIGLSLAYFLAQALGAELLCRSQLGSTTFWFSLSDYDHSNAAFSDTILASKIFTKAETSSPMQINASSGTNYKSFFGKIKEPAAYKPEIKKESIACCGLRAMDPPSVLVVEDTAMCAKMLKMTLKKFNCYATVAENGQIAIDLLKESPPDTFQLILMDLRMPVLDGMAATKIIKEELGLKVPVIALTAETSDDIKKECDEIGFDQFCSKPLKRDHLKTLLLDHLGYDVN